MEEELSDEKLEYYTFYWGGHILNSFIFALGAYHIMQYGVNFFGASYIVMFLVTYTWLLLLKKKNYTLGL